MLRSQQDTVDARSRRIVLASGVVVAALTAGCTWDEDTPPAPLPDIVLGTVLPLTGPNASYGASSKNGIDFAVAHVNERGGLLKRKVRVVHIDDQGSPDAARDGARRLVTQERVDLILGELESGPALEMAPIAHRAMTPMITPSATNPKVTEQSPYVFRICFTDVVQAKAMAQFAKERLGLETMAVVRDLSSAYSLGLAEGFREAYVALGGKLVAEEHYASDDESFDETLKKIAQAKPGAVYVPGYYPEVARILRSAKDLGLQLLFIGGDGWDTDELLRRAGIASEGTYFTTHFAADEPRAEISTFVTEFERRFNEAPDAHAALGHDAASLAIAVFEKVGSTEKAKVRAALSHTTEYPGLTGKIRFDERGNAIKPVVVMKVEKGKRTFVTSIAPR